VVHVLVEATEESEAGILPSEEMLAEMGKYNEELANAGVLLAGGGDPADLEGRAGRRQLRALGQYARPRRLPQKAHLPGNDYRGHVARSYAGCSRLQGSIVSSPSSGQKEDGSGSRRPRMPYLRCPNCALLAHLPSLDPTAIACPRCHGLSTEQQRQPVEASLGDDPSFTTRPGGLPPQD
jgi:hypothetical protein